MKIAIMSQVISVLTNEDIPKDHLVKIDQSNGTAICTDDKFDCIGRSVEFIKKNQMGKILVFQQCVTL